MKNALIVIDMQNDFIHGALKNPAAQAIVAPIAQAVAAFDGDVYATRDTHASDYLTTPEGKKLPVVHCVKDTDGWQIENAIQAALAKRGAKIVDKPTFGYLDWQFLAPYDTITLVGTCTDICVVSNALVLKALFPNATIAVRAKLCAGTTEENHEAALKIMRCCQVDVE